MVSPVGAGGQVGQTGHTGVGVGVGVGVGGGGQTQLDSLEQLGLTHLLKIPTHSQLNPEEQLVRHKSLHPGTGSGVGVGVGVGGGGGVGVGVGVGGGGGGVEVGVGVGETGTHAPSAHSVPVGQSNQSAMQSPGVQSGSPDGSQHQCSKIRLVVPHLSVPEKLSPTQVP